MEEDKNSRRRQLEEDQIGVCKTSAGRSIETSHKTLSILSNNYLSAIPGFGLFFTCLFFEIVFLIAELHNIGNYTEKCPLRIWNFGKDIYLFL